ncbi:Myb DNA-bind 5 domain containing protein [Asbolus verrucosus]|uniref:Regulatory protein zeste n=1 Tax=Asbolus verrucosus TaxID=1661398 RepID=A0A482VZ76_ASBVE|nr:Myb DNA-bind 5 domain containing protein [Asbolus verrucosus]
MIYFRTKIRSKNFTSTEITIMGPRLTQFHRDRAWEKVVEAVNAVTPVVRGLAEIKKKIRDVKTWTKQKANAFKRESRKTGGGENDAVPFSAAEQRVISFISNDSIEGIEGGVDTFCKEVLNLPTTKYSQTPQVPVPIQQEMLRAPMTARDASPVPGPSTASHLHYLHLPCLHLQVKTRKGAGQLHPCLALLQQKFKKKIKEQKKSKSVRAYRRRRIRCCGNCCTSFKILSNSSCN